MVRLWTLIAILSGAAVSGAAQDHYEASEADPAQSEREDAAAEVISAPPPAPPSGPGVSGISRRLGVPRLPARTPSRASGGGGGAPAKVPARAERGPKADGRPFLTGYVGVPYLAEPSGKHVPPYTGDDSFGYDLDGVRPETVGVILRSSSLPAGLSAMDRPDLGMRGAVLGVPLRAGTFFPRVQLLFLVGAGVKPSNFDGRAALRILPAPRHTVLNPNERSPLSAARFENDGPALLKVTLNENRFWSVVRSADGVTAGRVYFETRVAAMGDPRESRVGVDGGGLLGQTGRIGDRDSWAYEFSGIIRTPRDGAARAHLKSMVGTDAARAHTLVQVPKVVPGDVVMVAFDPAAGYLWFGKNGRWLEGGDPAAGAFPTVDGITLPAAAYHGDFRAAVQGRAGTTVVMNFGDQPWRYAPPRGFGGIAHRRATSLPPYPAPDRTSLWASGDIR